MHRIPANLIAEHLQFIAKKEKIKLATAAANSIARGAEGGLRDAESMLDQLVAFCGENIEEPDVLKVFGFTSQQTVAAFTEKIMRSETAEAVQLLHDECEAGKDMMRLMSDLITYLRDLLIYKAKPEALSGDVDRESQQILAAQSTLIETDRLLELIDQFAEAEGRMKWAPNKKLHFEVALIKAIQSLNQVTLGQVIETLKALREGKAEPSRPSAVPAPPSAKAIPTKSNPPPAPAKPVARVAERANLRPKQQRLRERLIRRQRGQRYWQKFPRVDSCEASSICSRLLAWRGAHLFSATLRTRSRLSKQPRRQAIAGNSRHWCRKFPART